MESHLQAKLLLGLRATAECYPINTIGGIHVERGTPDLVVCFRGEFLGIEVKAKDGRVRPLQRYRLEQIAAAGGVGILVKGDAGVKALLSSLKLRSIKWSKLDSKSLTVFCQK